MSMDCSQNLELEALALPAEEIHRLYTTFGQVLNGLTHDLRSDLSVASGWIAEAKQNISSLRLELPSLPAGALAHLDNLEQSVEATEQAIERQSKRLELVLGHSRTESPLVASPFQIARELVEMFGTSVLELHTANSTELEILFPRPCLAGLMHELVTNALRASSASRANPQATMSWRLEGHMFVLEVHDNGPGFAGVDRGNGCLLSDITRGTRGRRRGGLDIFQLLIARAGGFLIFDRSPVLDGALVTARIPVRAFYDELEPGHGRVELTAYQ